MSNKQQTAVEWLVKEISRDRVGRAIITTFLKEFEQAKEMESQKQQKYDEMLGMLEVYLADLNNIIPRSQAQRSRIYDVEQLIKEAQEL